MHVIVRVMLNGTGWLWGKVLLAKGKQALVGEVLRGQRPYMGGVDWVTPAVTNL